MDYGALFDYHIYIYIVFILLEVFLFFLLLPWLSLWQSGQYHLSFGMFPNCSQFTWNHSISYSTYVTCYQSVRKIFFLTITISFCFLPLILNNCLHFLNIVYLICNIIQDWTSCSKFSKYFWKNTKFKKVFGCPQKEVTTIFLSYKELTVGLAIVIVINI